MIHVNSAGFCDDQLPLLSMIGRGPIGPQGPRGDKGDVGIPTFADPIEWDPSSEYDRLTVVMHAGDSYTSIQDVPAGTDIFDTDYWAMTGGYNAQVEQYHEEVESMSESLGHLSDDVSDLKDNQGQVPEGMTLQGQIDEMGDVVARRGTTLFGAMFSSVPTNGYYHAVVPLRAGITSVQLHDVYQIGLSPQDFPDESAFACRIMWNMLDIYTTLQSVKGQACAFLVTLS